VQYDLSCLPADQISEVNDTLYFVFLNSSYKPSRSVLCLVPVPFRAVSNALTMSCRAVSNFLKAGHDTVKTRARHGTVSVPVSYLNPFRFQPCSYRSVPFPACLNLEHYLSVRKIVDGQFVNDTWVALLSPTLACHVLIYIFLIFYASI
jgi:hypothetical protein